MHKYISHNKKMAVNNGTINFILGNQDNSPSSSPTGSETATSAQKSLPSSPTRTTKGVQLLINIKLSDAGPAIN